MREDNNPPPHNLSYATGPGGPRWPWVACFFLGVFFLFLWFGEEAITFIPGNLSAEHQKWVWTHVYLFVAGVSIGTGTGILISRWRKVS